jgi:hypothetical protein
LKKGTASEIEVGTVGGFSVSVKATEEVRANFSLLDTTTELAVRIIVRGESEYSCEAGRNETDNNVVRLKNVFLNMIPKRVEVITEDVARLSENLEQAKAQIDVPFEHEDRIVELRKLLAELDERLSGSSQQEDVIADDDDLDEPAPKKSQTAKSGEVIEVTEVDDKPPTPDDTQRRGGRVS